MASYTNINVSPFSLLWEKYMLEFFVPIEKHAINGKILLEGILF